MPLSVSELCLGQDVDGRMDVRTDGQSSDYNLCSPFWEHNYAHIHIVIRQIDLFLKTFLDFIKNDKNQIFKIHLCGFVIVSKMYFLILTVFKYTHLLPLNANVNINLFYFKFSAILSDIS